MEIIVYDTFLCPDIKPLNNQINQWLNVTGGSLRCTTYIIVAYLNMLALLHGGDWKLYRGIQSLHLVSNDSKIKSYSSYFTPNSSFTTILYFLIHLCLTCNEVHSRKYSFEFLTDHYYLSSAVKLALKFNSVLIFKRE